MVGRVEFRWRVSESEQPSTRVLRLHPSRSLRPPVIIRIIAQHDRDHAAFFLSFREQFFTLYRLFRSQRAASQSPGEVVRFLNRFGLLPAMTSSCAQRVPTSKPRQGSCPRPSSCWQIGSVARDDVELRTTCARSVNVEPPAGNTPVIANGFNEALTPMAERSQRQLDCQVSLTSAANTREIALRRRGGCKVQPPRRRRSCPG